MKSKILQMHQEILSNPGKIQDFLNASKELDNQNKNLNCTLVTNYDVVNKGDSSNLLYGIPFSLKDLILTKDITTTGGSNFLKDFIPPYNSYVYSLLKHSGALMVSKTNCDEFGMGGTGLESFLTPVRNNSDNSLTAGGSSSGSAVQVSSGIVPFSIGTDTGDSIRRPASFCGVCGYKPTYGLISRYGCIPYAPSFDTLGVFATSVADCAIVSEVIVQHDQRDYTSQKIVDSNFYKNIKTIEKINFVVIEGIEEYLDGQVKTIYIDTLAKISQSHIITKVNVRKEILEAISPTYMTLTYAEACSCHANKTGIPFGLSVDANGYEDTLTKNRTAGFGKQVKRRMIIGSFITKSENFEAIYQRTKKVRTILINELQNILANGECLLLPGASSFAPSIDSVINKTFKSSLADDVLELANFAGDPSITIPVKTSSLPFGINITCKQFEDQKMFDIALTLEEVVNV